MLGLALAAGLALGARPSDLVRAGEEGAYALWLEGEARKAAAYYADADCAAAVLTARAFKPAEDLAIAQVRPAAALYAETFDVQGCGAARAQGLVVMRERTGWRAFPTAPGESQASLALQRQALPSVILAVKTASDRDTSCSGVQKALSALVYDTRITRPGAAGEPWSERWFMSVCGAGYKVDIDFIPTVDGATFDVRIAP
jgi:hypothetical protein